MREVLFSSSYPEDTLLGVLKVREFQERKDRCRGHDLRSSKPRACRQACPCLDGPSSLPVPTGFTQQDTQDEGGFMKNMNISRKRQKKKTILGRLDQTGVGSVQEKQEI